VDERVADPEATAHVALGIGEAMGGAVGAEQARLGQGAGIAPVGLDLAGAGRIHGREVRIGHDDFVAVGLETPGQPFTVGRRLNHNPGPGPGPKHGVEALGLGADALFHHFAPLGEDVNLAFPLVHVDANMIHSWLASSRSAALTAECACGAVYATTSSRRPAGFIPSSLPGMMGMGNTKTSRRCVLLGSS
jgi:hypothetical protein